MALQHIDEEATSNNSIEVIMKALESIIGLSHDHIGKKLKAFEINMVPFNLSHCDGPRPYSIAQSYTRLQLT